MAAFLLDPYDLEPPFAQRRLTVLSAARCGERTDWLWVRLEPPLEIEPQQSPGTMVALDVAAIAPRHAGASPERGPWPVHVHVCRATDPATTLAAAFEPEDVSIECWGLATPTVAT